MSESDPPQQLYVYNGTCMKICPEDWDINDAGTACVPITISDWPKIWFPWLCAAVLMIIIVWVGVCKRKPGRTKYISS